MMFLTSFVGAQENPANAPGLIAMIAAGGRSDARVDRLPAIYVEPGACASAFVEPGPFTVRWTGFLNLRFRTEYAVGAVGRGAVRVTLDGKPALDVASAKDLSTSLGDAIKVKKGATPIVVEYTPPRDGAAEFRLLLAEKGKNPEPPSPTLFTHDPVAEPALAPMTELRRGRQLVAELRCANCHATETTDRAATSPNAGPSLTDAGTRLKPGWVAAWVADPRSIRPDASMPRAVQTTNDAGHIAAYLATLGAPAAASPTAPPAEAADVGRRLFTGLGCVACHSAPDAAGVADRTPLNHVVDKYHATALVDYLEAPERRHPSTAMPNFALSGEEASQLAAYLVAAAVVDDAPPVVTGDPDQGRRLIATSGCLQCHALPVESDYVVAPEWSTLTGKSDTGCLAPAPQPRGRAPDFHLRDDDRRALVAYLATAGGVPSPASNDPPAEDAQRLVRTLNCVACHTRDTADNSWASLGDEIARIEAGLAPADDAHGKSSGEARPTLTWAGDKLRPDFTEAIIAGRLTYKPRPWLRARMPAFSAHAGALARGLAAQHGLPLVSPPNPPPDVHLAQVGRKLVGSAGGFSCVQCHGVGAAPPIAPFEAPAPNFAHASSRLREDWYHRWMHNPARLEPGTRMPQFADVNGKTSLRDVFDGDARRQFDAIWDYLLTGERIAPP